jgi:RNA polymerase sigma factor (sigma-70 family)
MQELDDNGLLREYVENGSEEAFATLVARHLNKVYSVALRHTSNPDTAEEIAQAVFVILARKSSSLGKRVILEGWLHQTARLTAITFIRSEIRRTRREQDAYMQSTLNENESDVWTQIAPLLDKAIVSLNETDWHAVVLRFVYGKSMKEVGAALGGSEGAATIRLHRALQKLRQFFLKRGIVSTTEIIAGAISANSVQIAPVALDYSSYGFNGLNRMSESLPGVAGKKLSSIRNSVKTVLLAEGSAFFGFSWHDPGSPPIFNNARSIISFGDGHTDYIRIYWDGVLGKTDSPMFYNPPAGYDYQWSGY